MDGILLYGESDRFGDELPLALPSWHADAACAGSDTERYYDLDDTAGALAVCDGCAARGPCLEWALKHDEAGVWGGTTDRDRERLRRGEPVAERKPAGLAPCGTVAAYARHRRRGEDACDACREANTEKGRAWRDTAA